MSHRPYLRYEDVPEDIMDTPNRYELEWGIQTLEVERVAGGKEHHWEILKAKKSDGTSTLFFAYRHKRATSEECWTWCCPSKKHIAGFERLIELYWNTDQLNKMIKAKLEEIKLADLY